MKRILLPTDFSDNAYNAIQYAVQLLANDVCEFYLLNTYIPVMVSAGSLMDSNSALSLQKVAEDNAQNGLDEIEKRINQEFPNDKHSYISKASFNTLISEMRSLINLHSIDFVVMGTKGATGAKEVFIGTHTMFAIKKMKCPVLAVPANFHYEPPKEILFPTDYKINENNKYLTILRDLCTAHRSRLHILNVFYGTPLTDSQIDNKSFLDSYFTANSHLFHIDVDADVIEAIEKFQIRAKINFLVMIHNKHSFFENLLFERVINQVVYHTDVPFLVIPSVERQ